ncbi:MAG: SCP2 sterol-binding domain-containing protein [Actinomycetota bacterium]|nr:SCP2 sterol-binding domain-containing protein [Actinomycetota bacterium]
MAVKFQSDEYFEEVNSALTSNEEVIKAAKGHNVAVQVVTSDMPEVGEKKTYFKIVDGTPEAGTGEIADPDATISQNYATAVALDKGELNPQTAFMEGKIKIKGNLMKMLSLQKFMQTLGPATRHIEREY